MTPQRKGDPYPVMTPMYCRSCGAGFEWNFEWTHEPVDDDGEPCCERCGSYDVEEC